VESAQLEFEPSGSALHQRGGSQRQAEVVEDSPGAPRAIRSALASMAHQNASVQRAPQLDGNRQVLGTVSCNLSLHAEAPRGQIKQPRACQSAGASPPQGRRRRSPAPGSRAALPLRQQIHFERD